MSLRKPIILASASPRRRELLTNAGISFQVKPAHIRERVNPHEPPQQQTCRLAAEKAEVVAANYPNNIVLGADTMVFYAGDIIGKPADLEHAGAILKTLSGQMHLVYTGVCLLRRQPRKFIEWHSVTSVRFKVLTDDVIEHCLTTTNPLDKAGGYAIQAHENNLVAEYTGLRSNVIGLPIEEVVENLKLFDESSETAGDVASRAI